MKGLKKWSSSLHFFFTLITMVEITLTVIAASLVDELLREVIGINIVLPTVVWLPLISLVIGALLSLAMNYVFFTPVSRLSKAMNRVAEGEFGNVIETKSRIREVRGLYDSFNLMTKALADTEMLQCDFVSNVSHEFKTPINAIEGYATLIQDSEMDESQRNEYIEKILLGTHRLSDLVGNILLLSKLDNSTLPQKTERFSLDEQIRQSILLLEAKWERKNITFDLELEETEYLGNETLLHHVWTNLIDNAIKFSHEGGVIGVRLSTEGENVRVSIEDNGIGIPESECEYIFDRFYQVDSSHKGEGNGLGLSIVKRIIDTCGGNISVLSKTGEGCTFTVVLGQK